MDYEVVEYEFTVGTNYVGSTVREIVEIEIPVGASEEEIEDIVQEEHNMWLWNNIDAGWNKV